MLKGLGARGRWHVGLVLLAAVVLLWVASGFIINDVSREYSKPYFITYVNTAMFVLYLGPTVVSQVRGKRRRFSVSERGLIDRGMKNDAFTVRETAVLASQFAVLWFAANLLNNASYVYTDVASATILACTSSFFTLLVGAAFGVETVTWQKIGALCVSISGVLLVTLSTNNGMPADKSPPNALLGNIFALGSAFFYGLYTTLLKVRVGDESQLNTRLFLGFVGLFNIIALWPFLIIFHVTGIETFGLPESFRTWILLIINNLGMLLSDFCWVLAMLMTTPLTVTVGLSATIPLSMIGEVIFNGRHAGLLYYVGAALVAWSFFVVNRSEEEEVVGPEPSATSSLLSSSEEDNAP